MHRLLFGLSLFFGIISSAHASELNIYSYRTQALLQPFLDAYSEKTGTVFNVVHAPQGLVERLRAEGANSRADIVLTVDISRITELAKSDLLAPLNSDAIIKTVPAHLRDKDAHWTALSLRARIIAISKDRVGAQDITRIEDLALPEWKGRVCTRKGSHVYNRALLASLIAHNGYEAALKWTEGLVSNLARRPQGNDRAQAKAIFAGECDVALMNTYYFGKMKFNTENIEEQKWADAIDIVFTNQQDRGQHVNITGGAILKTSQQPDAARAFLEWLVTEEAQHIYARVNYEYPVSVAARGEVASWGTFRYDNLPVNVIGELSAEAQKIINITGW